jgi:maspardin
VTTEQRLAVRRRHPVRSREVEGHLWRWQDTMPLAGTDAPHQPLVLLPGALGTAELFYRVLDALGGQRRIVAVSFPPIGNAEPLASELFHFLDAIGIRRIDLLGTSLGGHVAQIAAIQQPSRIGTLVLANTFADPLRQQTRWPPAAEYASQDEADILAAAIRQLEAGVPATILAAELRETLLALVGGEQSAADVKAMRLAVLTARPLPKVPLEPGSIVLIDDASDTVIAPETRDALRSRYWDSRQFEVAGGGHFPASLAPEAYAHAIRSALP